LSRDDCRRHFVTDATANISVFQLSPEMGPVPAVKSFFNLQEGTKFDVFARQYVYLLSTRGYPKGTYRITVTGDKFPPQSIDIVLK
jgi:hypothetical protein